MKNTEYIKAKFIEALRAAGYESEVWLNGNRGDHLIFFRKVVRGFIFCPILSLTKKRFSDERLCNFKTFIDLEFESEIRKDNFPYKESIINPSGPIVFSDIISIKAINPSISKYLVASKWFHSSYFYNFGRNLADAKKFTEEILPLLIDCLLLVESKFDFPKPLDMMSVDILIKRREAESKRDPTRPPEEPNASHLWNGFFLGSPEQVASMMISFNRKIGDLTQIAIYEDFLHTEKPATEQIVYSNKYYRRKTGKDFLMH